MHNYKFVGTPNAPRHPTTPVTHASQHAIGCGVVVLKNTVGGGAQTPVRGAVRQRVGGHLRVAMPLPRPATPPSPVGWVTTCGPPSSHTLRNVMGSMVAAKAPLRQHPTLPPGAFFVLWTLYSHFRSPIAPLSQRLWRNSRRRVRTDPYRALVSGDACWACAQRHGRQAKQRQAGGGKQR